MGHSDYFSRLKSVVYLIARRRILLNISTLSNINIQLDILFKSQARFLYKGKGKGNKYPTLLVLVTNVLNAIDGLHV